MDFRPWTRRAGLRTRQTDSVPAKHSALIEKKRRSLHWRTFERKRGIPGWERPDRGAVGAAPERLASRARCRSRRVGRPANEVEEAEARGRGAEHVPQQVLERLAVVGADMAAGLEGRSDGLAMTLAPRSCPSGSRW